jgi:hypothetical protein
LSSFSATTAFANDNGEGAEEGDFLAEKINSLLHDGVYLLLRDKGTIKLYILQKLVILELKIKT